MLEPALSEIETRVWMTCLDKARSEPFPKSEQVVCYPWVNHLHQQKFAEEAPLQAFRRLVKVGILKKFEHSPKRRCYYTVSDLD